MIKEWKFIFINIYRAKLFLFIIISIIKIKIRIFISISICEILKCYLINIELLFLYPDGYKILYYLLCFTII